MFVSVDTAGLCSRDADPFRIFLLRFKYFGPFVSVFLGPIMSSMLIKLNPSEIDVWAVSDGRKSARDNCFIEVCGKVRRHDLR